MGDDSMGRTDGLPPATEAASQGGCAIAAVRGDVTTARAAALVRARRRERGPEHDAELDRKVGRPRGRPGADAFPAHLLRVGPA